VLFFFATREPAWAREQRLEKEARETRETVVAPEDHTKK